MYGIKAIHNYHFSIYDRCIEINMTTQPLQRVLLFTQLLHPYLLVK